MMVWEGVWEEWESYWWEGRYGWTRGSDERELVEVGDSKQDRKVEVVGGMRKKW